VLDKVILEISQEQKISAKRASQIVEKVLYELSNNSTMGELMALLKKYSKKYGDIE